MKRSLLRDGLPVLLIAFGMLTAQAGAFDAQKAGYLPAGTLIPELSQPYALHFSNGDGTIRAEIGRPGKDDVTDDEARITTVYSGYSLRSHLNGVITWTKHAPGEIVVRYRNHGFEFGWPNRYYQWHAWGWIEWNISSIGVGATIDSVGMELRYQANNAPLYPPDWYRVKKMTLRPSTGGAEELWNDVDSGATYVEVPLHPPNPPNWTSPTLGGTVVADLQARLDAVGDKWFATGLTTGADTLKHIVFSGSAGSWPLLVVHYTLPVPDPPEPELPANGGTVATLRPTLQVGEVPDVLEYEFAVYQGATEIRTGTSASNSWTLDIDLTSRETYNWRARVRDTNGWSEFFTPDWTFTVRVPAKPALISPADGAIGVSKYGHLRWDLVEGADRLYVYMDQNPNPTTLQGEITEQLMEFPLRGIVDYGNTWYWRIIAEKVGVDTAWSDTRSFTVRDIPAPAAFALTAPDPGTLQPIAGTEFSWSDADPVEPGMHIEYELYLAPAPIDPQGSDPGILSFKELTGTTWTYDLEAYPELDSLDYNTDYNWDVKAVLIDPVEEEQWDSWSEAGRSFRTRERPIPLYSIVPNSGDPGQTVSVIVTGDEFEDGITSIEPIPGITIEEFRFLRRDRLAANFVIDPAAPSGPRDVIVAVGARTSEPLTFTVTIPGEWVEPEPLPAVAGDRRDAVGRGSWLAYDAASDLVYAAKGDRDQKVYVFDPNAGEADGEWLAEPLTEIPVDTVRPREIERGSRAVVVGGYLYVVHGNNTQLFWRYDITGEEWTRLDTVPLGPSGRPVRGGGDLVYAGGYIYLLKGDRTDFYRFNTAEPEGGWETLADAPGSRWQRDSWLAYDDENEVIYAHMARMFDRTAPREDWAHYLYAYDIGTGEWSEAPLSGMPLLGPVGRRSRRRRAGDGSSGAYYDGSLYALKGGNTLQLWQYDIGEAEWQHLDEMPLEGSDGRRRVNAGGYLISVGEEVFYALKGNRSNEFWRYTLPPTADAVASMPRPDRSGVMTEELPTGQAYVRIGPNPLKGGLATLRYSLPQAGPATVNVFDVTGRNVLSRSIAASQTGSVGLDLRSLGAGIYLLQFEAESFRETRKLVVQQ